MISKGFDLTRYRIELTKHVFDRANERQVDIDLIYHAIRTGKIVKFGKNNFKIIKRYKKFTLICVDEIFGDTIKIVTIAIK